MVADAHAIASSWSKGLRPLIVRGAASVGGQVETGSFLGFHVAPPQSFPVPGGWGGDLCHVAEEGHNPLLVYSASYQGVWGTPQSRLSCFRIFPHVLIFYQRLLFVLNVRLSRNRNK